MVDDPTELPDETAGDAATAPDGARLALVALLLAALATVALVTAPHAYLVDETADGTATELRFWWDQVAVDADQSTVPGASAILGLIAAATLTTGAVLAFVGIRRHRDGLALGGTATLLAGALPTVVYAALWTGRLLTTLVHTVAGYDAPAALQRLDAFPGDAHSAVWTVGPVAVLGLALGAVWAATRALSTLPVGAFDLRPQARRHLQAAWLSVVVLAVVFAVPWSAQTLPDNVSTFPGATGDDDTFWFGAYDAMRINEGTQAVAQDTNAGALVQYGELIQLLWGAAAAVSVVVLASLLGVHGTRRAAAGDRNLGNTWQGSVYAGIAAGVCLFAVVLLAALWLHRPNADLPDRGTFLGLAAAVPVVFALLGQVAVARELSRESGTLLADDFPEPIVYD